MQFTEKLEQMGACDNAIEWAKQHATFADAWAACERGDWMLWLAAKRADRTKVVLAAVECARLVSHLTDDERVEKCLATTERWCRREATFAEVRDAASSAAAASYVAAYDADAAAYAASSAAYAASSAAYAAHAAYAASSAADAAYAASSAYAASAAYAKVLRQCANVARKHFTAQEVLP